MKLEVVLINADVYYFKDKSDEKCKIYSKMGISITKEVGVVEPFRVHRLLRPLKARQQLAAAVSQGGLGVVKADIGGSLFNGR